MSFFFFFCLNGFQIITNSHGLIYYGGDVLQSVQPDQWHSRM